MQQGVPLPIADDVRANESLRYHRIFSSRSNCGIPQLIALVEPRDSMRYALYAMTSWVALLPERSVEQEALFTAQPERHVFNWIL